ncbi:MAG: winged helix-turn-helix domain-containing protein [Nitrososphaerales archaeon]
MPGDPAFRRLLYYLLAGTRGALNRVLILRYLKENPVNANKLSVDMKLDYKTIQHHLRVLEQNGLIVPSQKGVYGAVYFISPYMEAEYHILDEIWAKVNKTTKGE